MRDPSPVTRQNANKRTSSPKKTIFWLNADGWNAVATVFLVIVGILGIWATNRSLELSERAWLGANGGALAAPVLGQPLHFAVIFTNPGKEPATDLSFGSDTGEIPYPVNNDFGNVEVRNNSTCQNLKTSDGGGVVVPGGATQRNSDSARGNHPIMVDSSFVTGQSIVYAQGCVAYKTFGRIHHTSYCYVFAKDNGNYSGGPPLAPTRSNELQKSSNDSIGPMPVPVNSLPPSYAVANCPTGNSAD